MFLSPSDLRHSGASYRKYPPLFKYPHCIMYSPKRVATRRGKWRGGSNIALRACRSASRIKGLRWMRE